MSHQKKPHNFAPAERAYIDAWRNKTGRDVGAPETALALSGGGIRSAAYCLGVLQALAKHDILKRFDYLSTVSGGGYIGASLTWFTSKHGFGCAAADLPFAIDDPDQAPRSPERTPGIVILRHLRRYGNYLLPGRGINFGSGIGIVLRGILINLMVWLPLVTFCAVLLFVIKHFASLPYQRIKQHDHLSGVLSLLIILAVVFVVWCICYSFRTWTRPSVRASQDERGVPYIGRRSFEIWISRYLLATLLIAIASTLVLIVQSHTWLNSLWASGSSSAIGAIWGLASRFLPSRKASSKPMIAVAPIAAAFLLYGLLLGCFQAAWWVSLRLLPGPGHVPQNWPVIVGIPLVLLALALGRFSDLNFSSLHRYYRDRLMEAFLPDYDRGVTPAYLGPLARQANNSSGYLKDMCNAGTPNAPYHLINATLVLTRINKSRGHAAPGQEHQQAEAVRLEGGDSFLLSPAYCGCATLGWYPTAQFMKGTLTLATAMAISGAAVNPSAAVNGIGNARNGFFAALMSLLNVRLGFWVANPSRTGNDATLPNHFNPGLLSFFDYLTPRARLLELTDGGDFEDLGVYELIRRRVRIIVVCDAGADSGYAFEDLQNLLSRAEADFKAVIIFDPPLPLLGALMPSQDTPDFYPAAVKLSQSPFVTGEIIYAPLPGAPPDAPVTRGKLYYLKPAIFAALRLNVLGYKSANPEFPDDPTTNQFFSQAQFEAYRELGFASAQEMLNIPGINIQLHAM